VLRTIDSGQYQFMAVRFVPACRTTPLPH